MVWVRYTCSEQSNLMPLSVPIFQWIEPVNRSTPSFKKNILLFSMMNLSLLHQTTDRTEKRLLSRSGMYKT